MGTNTVSTAPDQGSRNWTELVRIQDGVAIAIDSKPLSQWRTDQGLRPTDEWLAENGYYGLIRSEAPSIDPAAERVAAGGLDDWLVDHSAKTVSTTWSVIQLSVEEIDERKRNLIDYVAFWDALVATTIYASIREQSFASLLMNTLATELIALLGDAKAGRANEAAIQASMAAILSAGTFTEAHLEELQAALEAGHIDSIYSIGL